MPYTYYDIGLNLFTKSFPQPEKIIEDAHAAGIQCILTGSEAEENELVNDFTKTHDVYGTAGIHPHSADEAKEEDVARIEEILTTNPRILAVGETGLDYDRMYSRKENQIHYFKELILLAEKLGKPLFLHERDAAEDFIACFAGHEAICPRAVVHCYTGDKKTLRRLLDMGFYIGITGWICDERRADDLREAVSILLLLLSPMVPHFAAEMWQALGNSEPIETMPWPAFDAEVAREEQLTIVLQVNGKVRSRLQVDADIDDESLIGKALADENLQKFLEGKPAKKTIVVKKKLVNIVV